MRLKFWGTHGGYPTDQQMTCMQFTSAGANILLDLGSVEIFKYPQILCEINAVLLTHIHSDHAMMLPHFVLVRLRRMGKAFDPASCPIYAPESPGALLEGGGFTADWVPWSAVVPETIGDIRVSAIPTRHARPCYAYKLQAGGKTVVVSGDTSYFDGLVEFARGADWFLCECNSSDERQDHAEMFGHMTPADVAHVVRLAKPKHTILYHLDMVPPEACQQAVKDHLREDFDVTAAVDGLELDL